MALPSGWYNQDIGSPIAGSADYADSVYTLQGAGIDIWSEDDQCHFAYQALNGNGTITARVASMTNTNAWAKAGVMIRESLINSSRHAMTALTYSNGVGFVRRLTTSGTSSITNGDAVSAPYWVRLTRVDSEFTSYQSVDGTTWVQVGSATISMAANVYAGLALTSHNESTLNTSTFDNVSLQIAFLTGLPRRALDGPFYGSLRGSVQ